MISGACASRNDDVVPEVLISVFVRMMAERASFLRELD
jgi:hypothetical protein